jgi:hypothetical protein
MEDTANTTGGWSTSGICKTCLKPFIYVGDTPENGWYPGTEPYCTCGGKKEEPKQYFGQVGWICPVCGMGLSPFTTSCPCKTPPFVVTCK